MSDYTRPLLIWTGELFRHSDTVVGAGQSSNDTREYLSFDLSLG